MAQVTVILDSIATAFNRLKDDVRIALHTQIGDAAQLEERIRACSRLLVQVNQVCKFKICSGSRFLMSENST